MKSTDQPTQPDAAPTPSDAGNDQRAPIEPPAQPGDKPVEVAKPVAVPVFQSVDEGKKELDAHPARTSTLTDQGHLVREQ